MQDLAEPMRVLDRNRPIEHEFGADLRDHLWVLFLASDDAGRIARHELLQAEHHHADQQQRGNDLSEAQAEMSSHAISPCSVPGCG